MKQQKPSTREEYSRRINIIVKYINNHLSNFSPYHFSPHYESVLGGSDKCTFRILLNNKSNKYDRKEKL